MNPHQQARPAPENDSASRSPGHALILRDVPIIFPFKPYGVQKVLMERVIEAAQNGVNALLESPTGTGKTLSLLCSTRAWQHAYRPSRSTAETMEPTPAIIYASRTHAQLEQAAKELRRTSYSAGAVVLGSRENQCIHETVKKQSGLQQIHNCKSLVNNKECGHRERSMYEARKKTPIKDIEDLGAEHLCPFYYVRDVLSSKVEGKQPSLIFMPYNYLVDSASRRGVEIPWSNAVIVIDEAHNIEDVCEEAYSFSLERSQLAGAVGEVDILLKKCAATSGRLIKHNLDERDLRMIHALLRSMQDGFEKGASTLNGSQRGGVLFDILRSQNITFENYHILREKLEECIEALNVNCRFMSIVVKCITRSFELGGETIDENASRIAANEFFRLIFTKESHDPRAWKLNFWCFSPGIVMRELKNMGVRSVIVASGTLTPIDSFAKNLRIPFQVRLESPHVVPKENVWLGVLGKGVTGKRLNGSYGQRDSVEYQTELGNTLVALANIIPDGMLVFFPSYSLLQLCIAAWKRGEIWNRLQQRKNNIIVEDRQTDAGKEYDSVIDNGNTAMLLAVCRGKASEGMDFKDHRARGVVVVSIPFPNSQDMRVIHKKIYMDEARQFDHQLLSGGEWYTQQGFRAVNQAIGRAIRHEKDFGAIILLDDRYQQKESQLSMWLRSSYHEYEAGMALGSLSTFFRRCKHPQPPKPLPQPVQATEGETKQLGTAAPQSGAQESTPAVLATSKFGSTKIDSKMPLAEVGQKGNQRMITNQHARFIKDNPSSHVSVPKPVRAEAPRLPPVNLPIRPNAVKNVLVDISAKIEPRSSVSSTVKTGEPPPKRVQHDTVDIKSFLQTCRGVLPKEKFSQFKAIVRAYHKAPKTQACPDLDRQFITLMLCVEDIVKRNKLMRHFAKYLPKVQQESFLKNANL